MGARTRAREAALQMLFALDTNGQDAGDTIAAYWREVPGEPEGRGFADAIVVGVSEKVGELDQRIRTASEHWRLERMTRVDRNVLRIGAWELFHRPEIPRAVILDEAVELAKRFGTDESGAFVNGVLDRIADDAGRRDETTPDGSDAARVDDEGAAGVDLKRLPYDEE